MTKNVHFEYPKSPRPLPVVPAQEPMEDAEFQLLAAQALSGIGTGRAKTTLSAIVLDFDGGGHLYAFASDMAPVKIAELADIYHLLIERRSRAEKKAQATPFNLAPYTEQELRHEGHHWTGPGSSRPKVDTCPFCKALSRKLESEKKVEMNGLEDFA